jgi:hypothetical protein
MVQAACHPTGYDRYAAFPRYLLYCLFYQPVTLPGTTATRLVRNLDYIASPVKK